MLLLPMHAILCFGDSITFGKGEKPAKGWCGRLKDYFEPKDRHYHVINLGFPGHTAQDILDRIDNEASTRARIRRDSDKFLILISVGTNDCRHDDLPEKKKFRMSEDEFKEDIQKLIEKSKKFPAKVAFLGLPPVDEKLTSPFEGEYYFTNERVKLFNDAVKESCEENNVLFLDIFDLMSKEDYSNLLEDGLHPNSEGYNFVFEKVKNFIESNELI